MGHIRLNKALLTTAALSLGLLMTAKTSFAQVVNIVNQATSPGSEGLGDFTGSLDYNNITDQLTVSLTNTQATSAGGLITAFVFDNPKGDITGATLATATGVNFLLGGPTYSQGIAAHPAGNFDIGACLNNNNPGWDGGGSPNAGIAVGQTGTWTFTFTGTGLNALTTQDFINATTDGEFLYVRYKGFNNGGSDKVGADVSPNTSVPEPAFYQMSALMVLGGIGVLRLRRKARTQA